MRKSKVTGLDVAKLRATILKNIVGEQNALLIAYAKDEISKIGAQIQTYHSRHQMDRTGNLLDSLCWGVSYDGKLVEGGFYREASARGTSYLHEWFSGDVKYLIPVNGHQLAEEYIQRYGNNGAKGWKVFFAILAPYWGYWEKGFTMSHGFSSNGGKSSFRGGTFMQFAVMAQFYDQVKADLKPMRTRFRVSIAKYDRPKLEKKWKKYAGL